MINLLALQLVDIIHGATTGIVVFGLILLGMVIQSQLGIWRAERKLKKLEAEVDANNR